MYQANQSKRAGWQTHEKIFAFLKEYTPGNQTHLSIQNINTDLQVDLPWSM